MTQEGLEEIFAQYASTIEAFRPIKSIHGGGGSNYHDDDLFDDDDDGQEGGDDLWIAEEEDNTTSSIPLPPPHTYIPSHSDHHYQEQQEEEGGEGGKKSKTNSVESTSSSIFSQPNLTISNESFSNKDKPLPALIKESPVPFTTNQASGATTTTKRISINTTTDNTTTNAGQKKLNRLSWTSDTGITSSIVSQNLANEIMSLFDMDFAIDIKVDTAPKLPELPFKRSAASSTNNAYKRRSQQRQSQDMLSTLIPAFEKIALENSIERFELKKQLMTINTTTSNTLVMNSNGNSSKMIKSVPTRSSSLRHRQELLSPVSPSSPSSPASSSSGANVSTTSLQSPPPLEKKISKKKSILHLASSLIAPKQHQQQKGEKELKNTPRKKSTSTVDSTTSTTSTCSTSSSSWSFISDAEQQQQKAIKVAPQKPLPEPPVLLSATGESGSKPRRAISASKNKKKRRSVVSKRKSGLMLQQQQMQQGQQENRIPSSSSGTAATAVEAEQLVKPGLSRSKSAFIKIGSGLKTKKQLKQIRRTSSAKNFLESDYADAIQGAAGQHHHQQQQQQTNNVYSDEGEETIASVTVSANSFVKRMTSFNWRMKPKSGGNNKPVVV